MTACVSIIALAMYIFLAAVSRDYPYYFIWDMDQVVAQDVLLLQDNQLPAHLNHTGVGMNLALTWSHALFHWLGRIDTFSLGQLCDYLSPMVGVSELAGFVRLHTPLASTLIALTLTAALALVFRPPPALSLLILTLLGTLPSLVYQSAMVRTELFSVLFVALALLSSATGATCRSRKGYCRCLLLSGALLGLAFFTKIQSIFLVGMVFVFNLWLLVYRRPAWLDDETASSFPRRNLLVMSTVTAVLFSLLVVFALRTEIPEGYAVFASDYRPNIASVGMLVLLLSVIAIHIATYLRDDVPPFFQRNAAVVSYLLAGFHLALIVHFAFFDSVLQGFTYLLYNVKMVYARSTYYNVPMSRAAYTAVRFLEEARFSFPLVVLHGCAVVGLVVAVARRSIRTTGGQATLFTAMLAASYGAVAFGTRFFLRDLLWTEFAMVFTTLCLLLLLCTAVRGRKALGMRWIVGVLLAVLAIHNASRYPLMKKRIDANYNVYGWQTLQWFNNVYGAGHLEYRAIMDDAYPDSALKRKGIALSMKTDWLKGLLHFTFPNAAVTLQSVGSLAPGAPVPVKRIRGRIARVSSDFENALLIDPSLAMIRPDHMLAKEFVLGHSEHRDKRKQGEAGHWALLPRPDTELFLALPQTDPKYINHVATLLPTTRDAFVIRTPSEEISFALAWIPQYLEVPESYFRRPWFAVVRPSFN